VKIRERLNEFLQKIFQRGYGNLEVITTPVENWVETRIMDGKDYVIGIDTYPYFYSAHWITSKKPSAFVGVLDSLNVEDQSESFVAFGPKKEMNTYKYSELSKMKDTLDSECTFIRVQDKRFTVVWTYEEAVKNYLVGLTSEKRNIDALFSLYENTASRPRIQKIKDKTLSIIQRYKE